MRRAFITLCGICLNSSFCVYRYVEQLELSTFVAKIGLNCYYVNIIVIVFETVTKTLPGCFTCSQLFSLFYIVSFFILFFFPFLYNFTSSCISVDAVGGSIKIHVD